MGDNSWLMAFRVFVYGFNGVFLALVTLLFCTKAISMVFGPTEEKEKKTEAKGG